MNIEILGDNDCWWLDSIIFKVCYEKGERCYQVSILMNVILLSAWATSTGILCSRIHRKVSLSLFIVD